MRCCKCSLRTWQLVNHVRDLMSFSMSCHDMTSNLFGLHAAAFGSLLSPQTDFSNEETTWMTDCGEEETSATAHFTHLAAPCRLKHQSTRIQKRRWEGRECLRAGIASNQQLRLIHVDLALPITLPARMLVCSKETGSVLPGACIVSMLPFTPDRAIVTSALECAVT